MGELLQNVAISRSMRVRKFYSARIKRLGWNTLEREL